MKSGRPSAGEFADYAAGDIAFVAGDDAVAALRVQRDIVVALIESLSEADDRPYAPGKWTLRQVIGHLIDDERIFAYRALCVARGETAPLPGFDEQTYAAHAEHETRTFRSLRDEYAAVRAATIALFEPMSEAQWRRRGIVNGYAASARGLAFHIAGHELHHLRIVREKYLKEEQE